MHLGTPSKRIYYPNQDENEEVMSFKAATDWYGNIVGKNLYKDYDLCFIVGTNNMPLPIYLLQFYQYSTGTDFSKLPNKMALEAGNLRLKNWRLLEKRLLLQTFIKQQDVFNVIGILKQHIFCIHLMRKLSRSLTQSSKI